MCISQDELLYLTGGHGDYLPAKDGRLVCG